MTAIDHADRKKLHGILLPAISAQVVIRWPGRAACRYTQRKWKRLWAAGYGIEGSTEDLPGDAYRAFVWWVETQAVTRMGVRIVDDKPMPTRTKAISSGAHRASAAGALSPAY